MRIARKERAGVGGRRSGFTLVEIMVATTISAILLALLLMVAETMTEDYGRTEGGMRQLDDADLALDMIAGDLEALAIPGIPGAQGLMVRAESVAGVPAHWLTLLSTAVDLDPANHTGVVRAISYRLAHQDPIGSGSGAGAEPVYALYRAVADAKTTFEKAIGVANLADEFWQNEAGVSGPTDTSNFLIGNVVGFEVRFLRGDTGQWTDTAKRVEIRSGGAYAEDVKVTGGLTMAEVSLTILSEEGAKAYAGGSVSLEDAIRRFGKTHVRQASVLPRPL